MTHGFSLKWHVEGVKITEMPDGEYQVEETLRHPLGWTWRKKYEVDMNESDE